MRFLSEVFGTRNLHSVPSFRPRLAMSHVTTVALFTNLRLNESIRKKNRMTYAIKFQGESGRVRASARLPSKTFLGFFVAPSFLKSGLAVSLLNLGHEMMIPQSSALNSEKIATTAGWDRDGIALVRERC